jgi:putative transposase
VIRINGQQYWLYAAVDLETNRFLHVRLFTTTTTALTSKLLRELSEKHGVSEAVFLVDHAHHLAAVLNQAGFRFQTLRYGNRNAVERIFREIKARTSSFNNSFAYVDLATVETYGSNRSLSGGIRLIEDNART